MVMKSKMFIFFTLILVASCRKSNYVPSVTPVVPDVLMSWNVVATISGETLSDIWFTSATRGFTLGKNIYQTSDGGMSWQAIPNTPGNSNFLNLFFVDAQYGFAQGFSQLATTVDGGNSWTVKQLPTTSGFTVSFASPLIGFYGDEGGAGLEKTTDAGKSWATSFIDPHMPQDYYPYFLNVDTGFVATGSGIFAATSDGGLTWQVRTKSLPTNLVTQTYNQLFFIDRNNGYYACPSGILRTVDGGQTWTNLIMGAEFASINVIRFVDTNTGYYKGLTSIYKTSDGGQTWNLNCQLGSDYFIGMHFLDIHNGWACTGKGRILRIQQ
jgi:photosystem II stability/assembly factor-like uncharacterized protein